MHALARYPDLDSARRETLTREADVAVARRSIVGGVAASIATVVFAIFLRGDATYSRAAAALGGLAMATVVMRLWLHRRVPPPEAPAAVWRRWSWLRGAVTTLKLGGFALHSFVALWRFGLQTETLLMLTAQASVLAGMTYSQSPSPRLMYALQVMLVGGPLVAVLARDDESRTLMAGTSSSRSATPAGAFPQTSSAASSTPSSPPRPSAWAWAWGSPSATRPCAPSAERSPRGATSGAARPSVYVSARPRRWHHPRPRRRAPRRVARPRRSSSSTMSPRSCAPSRDSSDTSARSRRRPTARLQSERFDVVLCDLMMPEMTGMELYARVCETLPDRAGRFLFMTGGAFTPASQAFAESAARPVLDKPLDLPRLERALDEVIVAGGS